MLVCDLESGCPYLSYYYISDASHYPSHCNLCICICVLYHAATSSSAKALDKNTRGIAIQKQVKSSPFSKCSERKSFSSASPLPSLKLYLPPEGFMVPTCLALDHKCWPSCTSIEGDFSHTRGRDFGPNCWIIPYATFICYSYWSCALISEWLCI